MSALVRDDVVRLAHRAAETLDDAERETLLTEATIQVRAGFSRGLLTVKEAVDLLADVVATARGCPS